MKTEYKWLHFRDISDLFPKRTTTVWICKNSSGILLGSIKWFGKWRQYCFFPENDTVFNTGCMSDITDFINQLKEECKKKVSNCDAKRKEG